MQKNLKESSKRKKFRKKKRKRSFKGEIKILKKKNQNFNLKHSLFSVHFICYKGNPEMICFVFSFKKKKKKKK